MSTFLGEGLIEYLCKFSALEGLVCGGAENNKKALLKERVSSLLSGPTDWKMKMADLWGMRCDASHQAKAFSAKFVQATKDVEFIFLAVAVFAAENMADTATIDDLWAKAKLFQLPEEAIAEPETLRGRVSRAVMPLNEIWAGIGSTINQAFKDLGGSVVGPKTSQDEQLSGTIEK